jgi:hypothetical protein
MEGMWNEDVSMEEIHQRILKSVMSSSEFDNELQKTFVVALLDLFISVNDGLNFFVNYYEPTRTDLVLFFKEPIIEIFGEKPYHQLENLIRKD